MIPSPKPPAGARSAFSALLAEHQGRLRAYILTLVWNPHLAEDLVQETNEVLCRKADQFEPGTNFRAWAFRIAFLRVMKQRRNAARDRLVFADSLVERLDAEAERTEDPYGARRARLLHCLERLSGVQRRLVLERYYEGRPVSEIAERWGQSANSISQALFRVRRALVECLNRDHERLPKGVTPGRTNDD